MRAGRSAPWGPIGLGVLAVVAAALVVLALQDTAPPPPTVIASAEASAEATEASAAADESDSPQPSSPADARPEATPPDPLPVVRETPLAVLSARSAVRATAGACPSDGAVIEFTDDQGRTWESLAAPAEAVLRVNRTSQADTWLVGASSPDCVAGISTSEDRGSSWVGPSDPTGAWHLELDPDASTLHAPFGTVESPCTDRALELEPTSFDDAWVLCSTGEVYATVNAGTSWESVGVAQGAVALGVVVETPVVAVPSDGDCPGLAVGALEGEALGCVQGAAPADVGLAFAGASAGFVVAGGETWTSNDGGATWTRRG
jgi:hypothetical protein